MALLTNALVRNHGKNGIAVVVMLRGEEAEAMFAKIKETDTEAFVMAETTNVNGHIEIHLNGEVMTSEGWAKKVNHRIGGYRLDQLLTSPIWVCKTVKSLYEAVMG